MAVIVALGAAAVPAVARAQDTQVEFWPELDIWKRLSPETQLFFPFAISHSREADFTEGTVGANIDHRFDVHISIRGGFRYIFSISDASTKEFRPIGEFTYRFFPGSSILILDRTRFDLRIINGDASWRLRNRLRAERTFNLVRENRTTTPYAMLEAGYDSRYDAVNRFKVTVGNEYQFGPRLMLDTYVAYQTDDHATIERVIGLGVALNLTL
jgi:hypothetical protein